MSNLEYIKELLTKYLKLNKIRQNNKLQSNYEMITSEYEFQEFLEKFNLEQEVPYLASGLSSYFNKQIEENGFLGLRLDEQDKEDAKFIANCFGKSINYSDNNLSILYTTLPGTTELNYARQTFPAGIYEDVFQCSSNHILPIDVIVGESEEDYYIRFLKYQIEKYDNFPHEKEEEMLERARRLTKKFCQGRNRVYLIPFNNVINHKASFGDVEGLRDGKKNIEEANKIIEGLPDFKELIGNLYIYLLYNDPNFTSEFGIAIYGAIDSRNICFFEVDRVYDLIQMKARKKGHIDGDIVSPSILEEFEDAQEILTNNSK